MITRPTLRPDDFTHETRRVGNLNMHYVVDGPPDGQLVVLLHGFPEFWYSWRWQIKALAAAGYRVIAPDQRGYNLTDKTPPYDVFTLAQDVVNLIETQGREKAVVVGHDWGGGVAWITAALHPDHTEQLIVMNCPHPLVLIDLVRAGYWKQIRKSWYIAFFQLPALPEAFMAANNYKALATAIQSGVPGAVNEEELGFFRQAWAQPGALNASISWYRAMFRNGGKLAAQKPIVKVPAKLFWGYPDFALTKRSAEDSRKYCPHLEITYVEKAGHFVQQDRPDEINRLLLAALS